MDSLDRQEMSRAMKSTEIKIALNTLKVRKMEDKTIIFMTFSLSHSVVYTVHLLTLIKT